MTFSPALSLGVATLDEYLDVRLIGAPDPEALLERLNAVTVTGLGFGGAVRLGPSDPRVTAIIDAGTYVVALAHPALRALGGVPELERRIAAFTAAESVKVRRTIQNLGRDIELKQFVTEVRLGGDEARETVQKAGIVGTFVPLTVSIRITGSGSAKIAEVVEALTGDATFPFKAVRAALTGRGVSPLELAAHRKEPTPKAPLSEAALIPFEESSL
jgi:hypothetical protein